MKKLTKQQALEILPLIVDNETSENEKIAFFRYIQTDDEVRKKYESILFVKQLLKTKYSPEKAPDHLKKKVSDMIEDMEWEKGQKSRVDNYTSSVSEKTPQDSSTQNFAKENQPPLYNLLQPARYLVAATVIFFFSLLTIEFLENASTTNFQTNYDVEEMALSHFDSGNHITASLASFRPISTDHASQILDEELSHQLRLPEIEGAELRRVLHTTFADGYTTPVLEFYQSDIDETVYVFAFKLSDLEKEGKINRDPEAVKLCKTYDDYHVKEIRDKHVVSWKWGDYWYTAVSNHNGNDLIALVKPLESN